MKLLFLAGLLSLGALSTQQTPESINIQNSPNFVPKNILPIPIPRPRIPKVLNGKCEDGICHPGYKCAGLTPRSGGLCLLDLKAPKCYNIGARCIDASDCCESFGLCAPPPADPTGKKVCQEDPCRNPTLLVESWKSLAWSGDGAWSSHGVTDRSGCCRACFNTEGCNLWFQFSGGSCQLLSNYGGAEPTDKCPRGLWGRISIGSGGIGGPVGAGPCLNPGEVVVS
ncbi:uncharacterized protein PADG_03533 [Paracoccidioides brasiliensis Pb18]|uniref:Apple domain-containing protein n=1 Tax=Paracoccidioides brasiliensis (strain Pb18) TaxID=502780 RepID=C1G8E7_PARBD|nr:uncharacterized protein PADG_03533 [Paracoccidioides brasiliensis Pb18]EEH47449.1 hypothetical protein PADG_03533 [Paracoccidioides brasiliensis Pb18]